MKLSKERTGHIVVRAYTNSEWDECRFAIIDVSEDNLEVFRQRCQAIKALEDLDCFNSASFFDWNIQWFSYPEQEGELSDCLSDINFTWSYVDIEDTDLDYMNRPEQKVDAVRFCVSKGGFIDYKGYGKYTSEEFWTDDFKLEELINN
jgi:hypothetical protein